ncbi:MAG: hypothetical protein ABSG72_17780 [Candidatus Sulfotelmatobacter sp.]|jgi:hypothetical protein
MSQGNCLGACLSAIVAAFAITAICLGQNTPTAKRPAGAAPKGQAASPVTMTECEGTNNCATWTFLGSQGNGQWPSGEVANLTVENFDADTVVIRRADSTGVAAGLTAVYKGTRHGDRIGGEFTSSWPGHWDGKAGNWYATIEKNSVSLPTLMHWCIDCANGMGGTLVWENGHYLNVNDVPGQTTILTVEKFTRESVVLHRTNSGRYPGSAVLTGQISAQGNSIANGIQTNPDGQTRTFRLAWGTALNTVPGSRRSDPQMVARPVVCYGWFFGIVCQ